jgi:hypothetical protein
MDLDDLKRSLAACESSLRRRPVAVGAGSLGETNRREAPQDVGRIAAALADEVGRSEEAQGVHVVLRVRHRPAVAVRARPDVEAPLLTFVRTDTVVAVDARQQAWARLHPLVHAQHCGGGDAWVLLLHDTYGPVRCPRAHRGILPPCMHLPRSRVRVLSSSSLTFCPVTSAACPSTPPRFLLPSLLLWQSRAMLASWSRGAANAESSTRLTSCLEQRPACAPRSWATGLPARSLAPMQARATGCGCIPTSQRSST